MDNELKKKYGLPTAIAMVVGIVIGSGVFFKAEAILNKTGGDMGLGILAWIIGGCIMMTFEILLAVMRSESCCADALLSYIQAWA